MTQSWQLTFLMLVLSQIWCPGYSCTFLVQTWNLLVGKKCLENKMWVLGLIIATGLLWLLDHADDKTENVLWKLWVQGGDACVTMWYLMPLNYTLILKWFKWLEKLILKFKWNHRSPPNSQKNLEKEQSGRYHASWFQTTLQTYNNQNRYIDHGNRMPRNKSSFIWFITLW